MTTISPIDVTFGRAGLRLAGHLRVPESADAERLPALVFTGPFTGVKEQVTGIYAEKLAAAGFVTLSFDHQNFGASEGRRRQHEDAAGKLDDLVEATSFLAKHPSVDPERIGCVGICMGGGYAIKHSAFDRRIKAMASVAGAFNDPRAMRSGIGKDDYDAMMLDFAQVATAEHASGEVEYINAVSDDEGTAAAMPGAEPFAYYGTERSAAPGWQNRVTRLSVRELLTTDLAMGADFIGPTPTLVVHGRTDAFCSPEGAQDAFDRVDGPKDIMWLDTTNHIHLYDQPEFVEPAVVRVAQWMEQHL